MPQPKLMSHTAIHHDWLALLHSCCDAGVVVRGKLHHHELAQNAGLTTEGDRVVLHPALDDDVPEDPKHAFR